MTEKWCQDAIHILIDAWHDEPYLFNTKCANYRNKHLRKEAIDRVVSKVQLIKDNATEDLCTKKFYNMRTDFVKEYNKVLASEKSGAGAGEVYKPSLWYYKDLLFLVNHVQPRKSKSIGIGAKASSPKCNILDASMITEDGTIVESQFQAGEIKVKIGDMQENVMCNFQDNIIEIDELNPIEQLQPKDKKMEHTTPTDPSTRSNTPASLSVKTNPIQPKENKMENMTVAHCSTRLNAETSTSKTNKKRKCDDDGAEYVDAMKAVVSALHQDEKEVDEIDAFCLHLGKIIRGISNPVRSLKLRMLLTNEAMTAQLEDQEEAKN